MQNTSPIWKDLIHFTSTLKYSQPIFMGINNDNAQLQGV
jgi:hypothetical protein